MVYSLIYQSTNYLYESAQNSFYVISVTLMGSSENKKINGVQ